MVRKKNSPHSLLQVPPRKRLLLSEKELIRRAKKTRLLITDNDGVLTDTGVYYGSRGEMLKRYSIRDGMGVERLRQIGIETAILSGEASENLRARAQKLRISKALLGVKSKITEYERILLQWKLAPEEIAFVGDDMNDLELILRVNEAGITAAPADAVPQISTMVHYLSTIRGGYGAFRDVAEMLIHAREREE